MVRVTCVITNKVELCSDKHYNDGWYYVLSTSDAEKADTGALQLTSDALH